MRAKLCCVAGEDSHLRMPYFDRMRDLGFDVSVVSSNSGEAFEKAEIPHFSYTLPRFINPFGNLRSLYTLVRWIKRHRPDIVHGFDTKPSLLAPMAVSLAGSGAAIRTINGMGYLFSSEALMARALRPAYRALQRSVAGATAMTVFQNQDDHRYFLERRLVAPERSVVVPGSGIDVAAWDRDLPSDEQRDRLRRDLGLEGKIVITMVSRLTTHKGVLVLLDAARRLFQRHPNVIVLLVGPLESEGPFAVKKQAIDGCKEFVRWLGLRKDVPALMGASDIFAFPSAYREGIPRVLLEAGLTRLPIVTSTRPGCTDVVKDGETGLLVPPHDVAELELALERLVLDSELRQTLGARVRRHIVEGFSMDDVVQAYCRLYETLLVADRQTFGRSALVQSKSLP
ncbi:MAG: glycosyltransferase family 4 protein [Geminicoccaceae bacterium]